MNRVDYAAARDLVFTDVDDLDEIDEKVLVEALRQFDAVLNHLPEIWRRRRLVYRQLVEKHEWNMTEVARRAGVTRQAVANQLQILAEE